MRVGLHSDAMCRVLLGSATMSRRSWNGQQKDARAMLSHQVQGQACPYNNRRRRRQSSGSLGRSLAPVTSHPHIVHVCTYHPSHPSLQQSSRPLGQGVKGKGLEEQQRRCTWGKWVDFWTKSTGTQKQSRQSRGPIRCVKAPWPLVVTTLSPPPPPPRAQ